MFSREAHVNQLKHEVENTAQTRKKEDQTVMIREKPAKDACNEE